MMKTQVQVSLVRQKNVTTTSLIPVPDIVEVTVHSTGVSVLGLEEVLSDIGLHYKVIQQRLVTLSAGQAIDWDTADAKSGSLTQDIITPPRSGVSVTTGAAAVEAVAVTETGEESASLQWLFCTGP